jgi:hypothetical protein
MNRGDWEEIYLITTLQKYFQRVWYIYIYTYLN